MGSLLASCSFQHGVLSGSKGVLTGSELCCLFPCPPLLCRGMLRMLPSSDQVQHLYARMPAPLEAALLPFQREGVKFGLARNGRCLIAVSLEMQGQQALLASGCQSPPLELPANLGVKMHTSEHLPSCCSALLTMRQASRLGTCPMCRMRWVWARRCRPSR